MADQDIPSRASNMEKAEGDRQDAPQARRENNDAPQAGRENNDAPQAGREDNDAPETRYEERGGAGITNRPLDEEVENQKEVPPRGESKPGAHAG
jgi:hypothetical protein